MSSACPSLGRVPRVGLRGHVVLCLVFGGTAAVPTECLLASGGCCSRGERWAGTRCPAPSSTPARVAESPVVRPAGRRAAPQTARPGPGAETEAPFRRQKRHPEEPGQFAVALVIVYRTLGQLLPELYDPDRRSLR